MTPVPAKLTVLAVREGGGRALFHLRCDPAAGNVAQPARACAAIAAQPSLVTNPKPFYDEGNNAAYFTITGSLNGKPVHFSGESDWTPQMVLIDKLGLAAPNGQPLRLEPSRHGTVGVNKTQTFAPGVLRPGDLVACRVHHTYQGPPLAMSVPIHRGFGNMSRSGAGRDGGPSTSQRSGHRLLHRPQPPTSRQTRPDKSAAWLAAELEDSRLGQCSGMTPDSGGGLCGRGGNPLRDHMGSPWSDSNEPVQRRYGEQGSSIQPAHVLVRRREHCERSSCPGAEVDRKEVLTSDAAVGEDNEPISVEKDRSQSCAAWDRGLRSDGRRGCDIHDPGFGAVEQDDRTSVRRPVDHELRWSA